MAYHCTTCGVDVPNLKAARKHATQGFKTQRAAFEARQLHSLELKPEADAGGRGRSASHIRAAELARRRMHEVRDATPATFAPDAEWAAHQEREQRLAHAVRNLHGQQALYPQGSYPAGSYMDRRQRSSRPRPGHDSPTHHGMLGRHATMAQRRRGLR